MSSSIPRFAVNSYLNQVESAMGRASLTSMPRYMTIVLGNGCNIDCPHCYQNKNGDNLLRNKDIGATLRREFMQIYPYLETLRIQGGEVFALKGFRELVKDISACTDRPLISISTNGTLIDAQWCQQIVETPFQTITISVDAGTAETFERVRRGAKFDVVMNNIRRIQDYKLEKNSWYPNLDAFFVIMRSNFREIPQFLQLMLDLKIYEVSLQTILIDQRNLQREPSLVDEPICDEKEIQELHILLQSAIAEFGSRFDRITFSGLKSLFDSVGLNSDFLAEDSRSLNPGKDLVSQERPGPKRPPNKIYDLPPLPPEVKRYPTSPMQCPNPWTTLFVTENGDISLCFLSEPVGNLYETPLIEIWNSPRAIAKRSHMLAGRYTESGCSKLWCDWRDGKGTHPPDVDSWRTLLNLFQELTSKLAFDPKPIEPDIDKNLKAIRRLLSTKETRIKELESNLSQLWDTNAVLHQKGQEYITQLEENITLLEKELKSIKATPAIPSDFIKGILAESTQIISKELSYKEDQLNNIQAKDYALF